MEENDVMNEKAEKVKRMVSKNASVIINEVEKIAGRPLTDEEKEKLNGHCHAFFMISTMMMSMVL